MRYLIITKIAPPYYSNYFDFSEWDLDYDYYVFDMVSDSFTKDGVKWFKIEK